MLGSNDKWEFYKDRAGEYRWRRIAPNGEIVGASVYGYNRKSSCEMLAERHGWQGNPNNYGSSDKWYFYIDKSGLHRWRRAATNGEIVGASTEGYSSRDDCSRNAVRNGMKNENDFIISAA